MINWRQHEAITKLPEKFEQPRDRPEKFEQTKDLLEKFQQPEKFEGN